MQLLTIILNYLENKMQNRVFGVVKEIGCFFLGAPTMILAAIFRIVVALGGKRFEQPAVLFENGYRAFVNHYTEHSRETKTGPANDS